MNDTLHEEAARYALLRRLAPTLRHHMAGEFQPLGMVAALLERRVQKNDLVGVQEQCAGLGQMSRQAAEHCLDLMNWVAPRGPSELALEVGLAQCVHLLAAAVAARRERVRLFTQRRRRSRRRRALAVAACILTQCHEK